MFKASKSFKSFIALSAALATAAVLTGCVSSGIIGADLVKGGKSVAPVMISWKSNDGSIDGTMTATLPSATYQGRFIQIKREASTDSLAPMWSGWSMGWSDWPFADAPMPMDVTQFSTVYSGRVIANLKSASGDMMRCRFQMTQPSSGMAGGGTGECQMAAGTTVQATF